jgi:hypothetical protein
MFRYLGAAFTARPRIPGSGRCRSTCWPRRLRDLGLASPAFWFLGLGLRAYLFRLASNSRFRRDRRLAHRLRAPPPAGPRGGSSWSANSAAGALPAGHKAKLQRVIAHDRFHADDITSGQNRESLLALLGHYARLLQARENLALRWTDDDDRELREQAGELEAQLKQSGISEELRNSKIRTLEIVQARIENQKRRAQMAEEIESELNRIEAHSTWRRKRRDEQHTSGDLSDLAINLARSTRALGAAAGRESRSRPAWARRRSRVRTDGGEGPSALPRWGGACRQL